jgi:TPR repeat protein
VWAAAASAQQPANSPALKRYRPDDAPALVRPYDESARLWQDFLLVKNANSGDAESQHELGLRYLFGEGFAVDTLKASLWISKAAAQRLPSACFNHGILLNNATGLAWDPYAAYDEFRFAAEQGVKQAQYAYGLFLLDNLAVKRDEAEARCWVKAAADSAYPPAVELFAELDRRNVGVTPVSHEKKKAKQATSPSAPASGLGLVLLDFHADTSAHVNDETLLQDLASSPADSALVSRSSPASADDIPALDSAAVAALRAMGDAGNPDALTMLGRWLERKERPDKIQATLAYARAIRLESTRSPELLWDLVQSKGYFESLHAAVDAGSPDAALAWAMLASIGFDNQITGDQALAFLSKAGETGNAQALVELGLCAVNGQWTAKDRAAGLRYWERAAQGGSEEATIRLISMRLLTPAEEPPASEAIGRLREDARMGSTLAQLALAYAAESGRGMPADVSYALHAYRTLAQRGSRVAYESLKRMYDTRRPAGRPEFSLER